MVILPDLPVTSRHPSPHQLSVLLAMAHTQYLPARLRGAQMQDQSPPLQRPTGRYSKLIYGKNGVIMEHWSQSLTPGISDADITANTPGAAATADKSIPLSVHAHADFGQSTRSGNLLMWQYHQHRLLVQTHACGTIMMLACPDITLDTDFAAITTLQTGDKPCPAEPHLFTKTSSSPYLKSRFWAVKSRTRGPRISDMA